MELLAGDYVNHVFNDIEDPVGAPIEQYNITFNFHPLLIFRQSGQPAV